jgi:hypothetical protein
MRCVLVLGVVIGSFALAIPARADCPNLLGKWDAPRIVNGVSTHAKTVPTQNGITPDCTYAWAGARAPKTVMVTVVPAASPPPTRQ